MTSGKASRDAREAKAAARRAAVQRAESRRKNSIRIGVAVVILLVVAGFGALIQSQRSGSNSAGGTPKGTSGTANQSIVVGDSAAPVSVVIYEDLQCPICKQYEQLNAPTLQKFVADKTVKIEYRPVAFLDRFSSTAYATRSLNSIACVLDAKPDSFEKFHSLLFANQPAENTAGLPDSKLIELAGQAGATGVDACIKDQSFKGWTARVTDQASKDGVKGTPTILVNDKPVEFQADLAAAITAAAKEKGVTPTGAATPTGTSTPAPSAS